MNNGDAARGLRTIPEVFADERLRRAAFAAERGDVAEIRALGPIDLDAMQPWGVNLLMYEIMRRDEMAVRALLEAGADPNALTPKGGSPMLAAAANNETRWLEILMEKGGDPNLKNAAGEPLLVLTAPYSQWDNMILLLNRGARIDDAGISGQTAIMVLGMLHQFDRVDAMLDRGADPTRVDANGLSLRDFVEQPVTPDSPQQAWRKRVAERLGILH